MDLINEKYLTTREIAEVFRVTIDTVYAWIRDGDIDAVQMGGTWRVPRSQFERARFEASAGEGRKEASNG